MHIGSQHLFIQESLATVGRGLLICHIDRIGPIPALDPGIVKFMSPDPCPCRTQD